MRPDARRRPDATPAVVLEASLPGESDRQSTPACVLACGAGSCPWRCPLALDDAVDGLLAGLLAAAQ